jgi:hypothetical protein
MKWIISFSILVLYSCNESLTYHDHLRAGLSEYSKKRIVNEKFVENYMVQEIALFSFEGEGKRLVLKLNNDISEDTVEKYTLGIHAFTKRLPADNMKGFLIWDRKPHLEKAGTNNYVSVEIKTGITSFDSINFFLYDREEYTRVESNLIRLKNIKFK